MADKLPRVIGLDELLSLTKPLRERPAPLIYFTEREFKRMLKGVIALDRPTRGADGVAKFLPWPGGGLVPASCSSPDGQICIGPVTFGGVAGNPTGVIFGCQCHPVDGLPPPFVCQVVVTKEKRFSCTGKCEKPGHECQIGYWRDPKTGTYTMQCRCKTELVTMSP